MAYTYVCPVCNATERSDYNETKFCDDCKKVMRYSEGGSGHGKWLHRCQSCSYSYEASKPETSRCPLCGGSVCPSRPH